LLRDGRNLSAIKKGDRLLFNPDLGR